MSWVPFALATAVLYGLQGAWSKRMTRTVSPLAASWAIFAFAFPLLLGYLAISGLPALEPRFWPALAVNVILSLLSFWLYVTALDLGELGLTYPLLALTPIFLVPVEWVLLGDVPGRAGLGGIALVVGGVYLLNLSGGGGLLQPFRAVARDPGARRMLLVALLWSVSGVVDKVAVTGSSTPFYGTLLTGALGLAFLPLVARKGEGVRKAFRPGARGLLVVQGLLFGTMFVCQMEALQRTLAAYVITVKRGGALLTVLLGALLFEEEGLARRLLATAVIVAGVLLLTRG